MNLKKVKMLCTRPLKEISILSDGRITTCCIDSKGENAFANIYNDDYQTTLRKFQGFKYTFAEKIKRYPLCVKCFKKRKKFYNEFHHLKPSAEETERFLSESSVPRTLVIELTSRCNLSCVGCICGQRRLKEYRNHTHIDVTALQKWLEPAIAGLKGVRLYNYGETFLHPDAIDFCSFLTGHNPYLNINIATNILLLNTDEKIEKLIAAQPTMLLVSLHGAGQKSIETYMGTGADFQSSLDIMKKIIQKRDALGQDMPIIIWKYLLFDHNDSDEEMATARLLKKEHGIDYLGFDIAHGNMASTRFCKGSNDFELLAKQPDYIRNVTLQLIKQNPRRKFVK